MASSGGKQTIIAGSIRLDIPLAAASGAAVRQAAGAGQSTTMPVPPIFRTRPDLVRPISAPQSPQQAEAAELPDGLARTVSASTPIDVELTPKDPSELSDAHAIFPVVQDDRFFYIAGPAVKTADISATHRSRNAFNLTVTKLPDVSVAPAGPSETRIAIGRALKLGFFKILRVPSADVGLRVPRLENNKVYYRPVKAGELQGDARVALLVHGFLSETSWMVQALLPVLQAAGFPHIVTWDYETFTTAVRDTAGGLAESLRSAGVSAGAARLDVIAHSMGGLVTRTLIAQAAGNHQIRRALLMGTPSGGTPIAAAGDFVPEVASLFLNHYVPGLSLGPVTPDILIRLLWRKIEKGMNDLQPDSDFIRWVNSNPADQITPLTLVVGDAAADDSANLFQRIFHGASNLFYGGPNDLVVPTSSMARLSSPPFPSVEVQRCPANHFNYLVPGKPSRAFVEQWIK